MWLGWLMRPDDHRPLPPSGELRRQVGTQAPMQLDDQMFVELILIENTRLDIRFDAARCAALAR